MNIGPISEIDFQRSLVLKHIELYQFLKRKYNDSVENLSDTL